jgi:hypothetical protein
VKSFVKNIKVKSDESNRRLVDSLLTAIGGGESVARAKETKKGNRGGVKGNGGRRMVKTCS